MHKQEDHDQLRSPFPKGKLLEIDNKTISIIEERHAHQLKYMQAKYKDIQYSHFNKNVDIRYSAYNAFRE